VGAQGTPFVEIRIEDFDMEALGAFFQNLS
jgi:hypothetical protein